MGALKRDGTADQPKPRPRQNDTTGEVITSIRELDTRLNDGLQVRLLWCEHDGRLWVTVLDTKTGDAFRVRGSGRRAIA